jgi:hypothetical protein
MVLVGNSGLLCLSITPKGALAFTFTSVAAARLAFAAYPHDLGRSAPDLQGNSGGALPTPCGAAPNPLSFTSSSKTRTGNCGLARCTLPMQCRYRMALIHLLKLPLLWFSKERPSAVLSPFASGLCPHLCEETDNRCLTAKSNTSSVHAVPPGYDGLLRKWLCRCIAPYFQPWGSSRFQHNLPFTASLHRLVPRAFPRLAYRTLRSFTLRDSRTVSPQPLPSRRCLLPLFPVNALSTARRCSIAKSVSR